MSEGDLFVYLTMMLVMMLICFSEDILTYLTFY